MIPFLMMYACVINIIGLWVMRHDKLSAVRKRRRIPERRLFTIAAIGGAAGCWFGMRLFRHKTKHRAFVTGMPLLLLFNLLCSYTIYTKLM